MLTAQDMTYDEARNLHSKWLKHQAFMAELQSNKEWLDKINKVGLEKNSLLQAANSRTPLIQIEFFFSVSCTSQHVMTGHM